MTFYSKENIGLIVDFLIILYTFKFPSCELRVGYFWPSLHAVLYCSVILCRPLLTYTSKFTNIQDYSENNVKIRYYYNDELETTFVPSLSLYTVKLILQCSYPECKFMKYLKFLSLFRLKNIIHM